MSARKIGKVLRDMGPLMLIALLVPGGILIAWVIYLLRRMVGKVGSDHGNQADQNQT